MKKFIRFAIFILVFVLHLKSFCEETGYIWFPLAWTFSFNKANSDINEIKFNTIKLIFQDVKTGKNIYSIIKYTDKNNNVFKLNNSSIEKTLFSLKLIKIPEGEYEFIGAIAAIFLQNNEVTESLIKFTNPFGLNKSKNINFVVKNKNISSFPAMSFETNISVKNGIIKQLTAVDVIEEDFISVSEIYYQVKPLRRLLKENKIGFINANDQFPQLQINGALIKNFKTNYFGLIIDISCDIKGNLKFVWVNKKSPLQYAFYENLDSKKIACNTHSVIPVKFYLPVGNWVLQSMTIDSLNKKEKDFYTWSLINKDKNSKKYFNLNDTFFKYLNSKERTLLKKIEINLSENKNNSGVYFLGSSEVKRNKTEKEKEKNKEELSFYFKRNYEIVNIKKLFSVSHVYNAYSGEVLKKDRIIGDVQLKINLLNNNNKLNDYLDQLKKYATTDLSVCVTDQEVYDPLLVLNGSIKIQNFKNKTMYINISNKDFNFASSSPYQNKIIDCLEDKLKKFKFSKPFSTPFHAKILFESY